MKVIINADDFGFTDGVCRSILELLEAQAISSTTAMAAVPGALEKVADAASILQGCAGVHLQLTQGMPLSAFKDAPSVFDDSKSFSNDPRIGRIPEPNDVLHEWTLQIEAFIDALGSAPTHLDTHHGFHRHPEYFEVVANLATTYNVPIRKSHLDDDKKWREASIDFTEGYIGSWTGQRQTAQQLFEAIEVSCESLGDDAAIEICVHPGYNDAELTRVSSWNEVRVNDHQQLLVLQQSGLLHKNGFELVSYRQWHS